jgi:hypothetical protein
MRTPVRLIIGIGWRRERLVVDKGTVTASTLHQHRHAWKHAADRAPHGVPIELKPEDFSASDASRRDVR